VPLQTFSDQLEAGEKIRSSNHLGPAQGELAWLVGQLPDRERLLFELTVFNPQSHRVVASAVGLPLGSISRHRRRMMQRFRQPIAKALFCAGSQLDPPMRSLAVEHAVKGTPIRRIARDTGMSYGLVRQKIAFIKGWAKAQLNQERAAMSKQE